MHPLKINYLRWQYVGNSGRIKFACQEAKKVPMGPELRVSDNFAGGGDSPVRSMVSPKNNKEDGSVVQSKKMLSAVEEAIERIWAVLHQDEEVITQT